MMTLLYVCLSVLSHLWSGRDVVTSVSKALSVIVKAKSEVPNPLAFWVCITYCFQCWNDVTITVWRITYSLDVNSKTRIVLTETAFTLMNGRAFTVIHFYIFVVQCRIEWSTALWKICKFIKTKLHKFKYVLPYVIKIFSSLKHV